jgi:hypothetical protein
MLRGLASVSFHRPPPSGIWASRFVENILLNEQSERATSWSRLSLEWRLNEERSHHISGMYFSNRLRTDVSFEESEFSKKSHGCIGGGGLVSF